MNQAFATNQIIKGGNAPMTVNGSNDITGDIYIARREFLGNVTATGVIGTTAAAATSVQSTFSVQTYNINAALSQSFPWLSQIARNFTFYEFEGLIYEYKPISGEYGNLNTNALGKVVLATQYDPDAPDFSSTIQMENYDYATSSKPSEHMLHGVECKNRQKATNMLYTRVGASAKDEVLTDLGDFQVATEGVPLVVPAGALTISQTIGELWVTYKCKLSRANIYNSVFNTAPPDYHIAYNLQADIVSHTTAAYATAQSAVLFQKLYRQPLPNNFAPKLTNSLGTDCWGLTNTTFVILMPPGFSGTMFFGVNVKNGAAGSLHMAAVALDSSALNTAIVNGYVPPNSVIGAVTVGTTTLATAATSTGFIQDNTNGIYLAEATSGTINQECAYYNWMKCVASSNQVCGVKVTVTGGYPTSGQTAVIVAPMAVSFTN